MYPIDGLAVPFLLLVVSALALYWGVRALKTNYDDRADFRALMESQRQSTVRQARWEDVMFHDGVAEKWVE